MRLSSFGFLALWVSAGCGPAPYVASSEPAVYVIAAPAPVVATAGEPAAARTDESSPFVVGQVWSGTYVCAQGETDLQLIVVTAEGSMIRAVFDFNHAPSGAKGSYLVTGRYDAATGKIRFRPGEWIVRPRGYVTVGMEGELSPEEDRMTGRITHDSCGGFDVSLAQGR